MKPIQPLSSVRFFGRCQPSTPCTFTRSIRTRPPPMTNPRYSTSGTSKIHFSGLRNSSCSSSLSGIWCTILLWVVREVGRGRDEDVVHVDYYFPCCREIAENSIHHGLERAWGVC